VKYFPYLLILTSICAFAQTKTVRNDSILIWNKNEMLIWNDFLSNKKHLNGRFDSDLVKHTSAILSISIDFLPKELSCKNVEDIIILPVVNRMKSFAILRSDEILKHEQIHFDIAELYARKMRKAIKGILEKNYDCNLQMIADIYYQLDEEHWETQILYDKEIRIKGEEDKNQRKWDKKVDSLLTVFKDYEQEIFLEDIEFE